MPLPDVFPEALEEIIQQLSELNEKKVTKAVDQKDSRAVKSSLRVIESSERTFVIVVATHKDKHKNQLTRIRCRGGSPLGGYAYDNVNDSYIVRCIDYLPLGYLPMSFKLTSAASKSWSIVVPIPESIILKNLDELQKMNLDKFKNIHNDGCQLEYLQLVG